MALMTPESLTENTIIDFRAPPPSPVASGRRSSVTNEDVLFEYLENSLKVPDLVLPDRVFPKQKFIENPSKLDLQSLTTVDNESIKKFVDSVSQIGCFEIINHGVPKDLIKSVLAAGNGIFSISPEKRKLVTKSLDRPYGFEEFHGEEEREMTTEEFVWCKDDSLKVDMEGILPHGYSNFSDKMEKLVLAMENVASKILPFLEQNTSPLAWENVKQDRGFGSICYLHKHCHNMNGDDQSVNSSMKYDVIRMLVRGSEFTHALCLHLCNGSEEFHVYSKKGWVSFRPDDNTLVVTIGDQLQAWSRGLYKHVIGKPIFRGADQGCMSMALMYSPPDMTKYEKDYKEQTITVSTNYSCNCIHTLVSCHHLYPQNSIS